ncbi:lipoprotein [Pseudomonas sp. D1-2]
MKKTLFVFLLTYLLTGCQSTAQNTNSSGQKKFVFSEFSR